MIGDPDPDMLVWDFELHASNPTVFVGLKQVPMRNATWVAVDIRSLDYARELCIEEMEIAIEQFEQSIALQRECLAAFRAQIASLQES